MLHRIKDKDPRAFPRKNSPRSGAMFRRMVNPDNLSRLTDARSAPDARLKQAAAYVDQPRDLFLLYAQGGKYPEECLALAVFRFRAVDLAWLQVDALFARFPPGFGLVFNLFNQRSVYSTEQLSHFAADLAMVLPPVWRHLDGAVKEALLEKLEQSAVRQPNLGGALRSLNTSLR